MDIYITDKLTDKIIEKYHNVLIETLEIRDKILSFHYRVIAFEKGDNLIHAIDHVEFPYAIKRDYHTKEAEIKISKKTTVLFYRFKGT